MKGRKFILWKLNQKCEIKRKRSVVVGNQHSEKMSIKHGAKFKGENELLLYDFTQCGVDDVKFNYERNEIMKNSSTQL